MKELHNHKTTGRQMESMNRLIHDIESKHCRDFQSHERSALSLVLNIVRVEACLTSFKHCHVLATASPCLVLTLGSSRRRLSDALRE